jgi:hypothetical protein
MQTNTTPYLLAWCPRKGATWQYALYGTMELAVANLRQRTRRTGPPVPRKGEGYVLHLQGTQSTVIATL